MRGDSRKEARQQMSLTKVNLETHHRSSTPFGNDITTVLYIL